MSIVESFFLAITVLLGIPVLWFCLQIAAACFLNRPFEKSLEQAQDNLQKRVTVLVPAHNESDNLLPTLRAVLAQAHEGVRVLVVADNCNDDTAEVARKEGVEVIERNNPALRGKGYALDFGIQHLKANPPQVVIILDADCLPESGVLARLADRALATSRPVQALYLMKNWHRPSLNEKIAEFAWLVKNHVRPKGLQNMDLPCHLTGSGMAFSWEVLQGVSLATGNIVEDMKLGMTFTAIGKAPQFSEDTVVTSAFPNNKEGIESQRTRWEHGHLAMMWQEGLPRIVKGVAHGDKALVGLALDLCIPPLALLVMVVLVWIFLAGIYGIASGNAAALVICLIYLAALVATVGLAWLKFGRAVVTGRELLKAPVYVLAKLPVYVQFLFRRQAEWVRSKRDNETK